MDQVDACSRGLGAGAGNCPTEGQGGIWLAYSVGNTFGIAERLQDGASNWRELVDMADRRMYEAKRGGRNRIVAGRS